VVDEERGMAAQLAKAGQAGQDLKSPVLKAFFPEGVRRLVTNPF
jgi:hypothetical protein